MSRSLSKALFALALVVVLALKIQAQPNGPFTFSAVPTGVPGIFTGVSAWGDFDNDGRLDCLVTGRTGTNYCFTLYRSTTSTANTVPNAPQGLSSASTGATGVRLSWNAASDLETPASGLSYNVRIGTAPGKCDILSPAANSATGQRYLAELGNAQERLFQVMANLIPDFITGACKRWIPPLPAHHLPPRARSSLLPKSRVPGRRAAEIFSWISKGSWEEAIRWKFHRV